MMFERIAPERYDSLPGIPEPAENPFLVGHQETAAMLARAYRAGKLHHAILLAGPAGIGKATLAFHLAHHLFAHPDPQSAPETLTLPDPAANSFRLVAQDAHPSLMHLTRPYVEKDRKFKTVITVEEIRRVSRFLSMTAHDGGCRVVIVDPADDMNNSATNALLKNLEEPPPRTIFVLIAHSLGRLLPTIRSRCQIVRLQPLASDELLAVVDQISPAAPKGEAARAELAQRAAGSPRNAVLLSEYGGLEIAEMIERIAACPTFDVAEAHRLADGVSGRDKTVQFSIFNNTVLGAIAARAEEAAGRGDIQTADAWSRLWEEIGSAIQEAETYNLDRKQHVIGTMVRLQAVAQATGAARM